MQPLNIDPNVLNGIPLNQRDFLVYLMRYGFDAYFVSANAAFNSPLAQHIVEALKAMESYKAGVGIQTDTTVKDEEIKALKEQNLALASELQSVQAQLLKVTGELKAFKEAGDAKPVSSSGSEVRQSNSGMSLTEQARQMYGVVKPDTSKMSPEDAQEAMKTYQRLTTNAVQKMKRSGKKLTKAKNSGSSLGGKAKSVAQIAHETIAKAEELKTIQSANTLEPVVAPNPPAQAPVTPPVTMSQPSGLQIPDFMKQSMDMTAKAQRAGIAPPQPMMAPNPFVAPTVQIQTPSNVNSTVAQMIDGMLD